MPEHSKCVKQTDTNQHSFHGSQQQERSFEKRWAQLTKSKHRATRQSTVGNNRIAHMRTHYGHQRELLQDKITGMASAQMSMPIANHTRHIMRQ